MPLSLGYLFINLFQSSHVILLLNLPPSHYSGHMAHVTQVTMAFLVAWKYISQFATETEMSQLQKEVIFPTIDCLVQDCSISIA